MGKKNILNQLNIQSTTSLLIPDSGFIGLGAKNDGLYQKISTGSDLKLATTTDLNSYAPLASASATLPATIGWYRIATSTVGINRCSARFEIDWILSGYHGQVTLNAGIMYGTDPTLNMVHYSHFGTSLSQVRIVYHTTYSGNYAYLEVYNSTANVLPLTVQMFSTMGWSLIAPNTAGSIPAGYTSQSLTFIDGIATEGILYGSNVVSTNLTDGYIPYHSNDTTGLINSSIYNDSSNNIGIGISTPISSLHIKGNSGSTTTLSLTSFNENGGSSQNAKITYSGSGTNSLDFSTGYNSDLNKITISPKGSTAMTLLGSGNVGIGYNSGTEITNNKLAINGTIYVKNDSRLQGNLLVGANKTNWNDGLAGVIISAGGGIEINSAIPTIDLHYNNSTADFTTRIFEYGSGLLTIMNNQGLFIGSSYKSTQTEKLYVDGTATVNGNLTSNSLQIGSAKLLYDSTSNSLYVQKSDGSAVNFYSTGAVSAFGQSSNNSINIDSISATTATVTTLNSITNNASISKIGQLFFTSTQSTPTAATAGTAGEIRVSSSGMYLYSGSHWLSFNFTQI